MAIPPGEILENFKAKVTKGKPIIGGGASTRYFGQVPKPKVDLIVIYNSWRYRMAGRASITGLFAYADANAIMMEMVGEVLPKCPGGTVRS